MSETFKAVTVSKYGDPVSILIKDITIPNIPEGHVLIRNEFATLNPGDEYIYTQQYKFKLAKNTLGFEGSGTVVKSGGGVLANSLLNKRVAFLCFGPNTTGAFAEYTITDANTVLPIQDTLNFEQAAIAFHALTVEYMMKKIKKGNHKVIIQNAASSYIGKTLIKYCNLLGITTINIVRRDEQIEVLNALGAEYVINSSEEGWKERVRNLARSLKATIAFDGVAGEMTGDLYELLPEPGVLYVYGFLSEQPCAINPMAFTSGKKIKGMLLMDWLNKMSVLKKNRVFEKVQKIFDQVFSVNYCATVDLNGFEDALSSYRDRKTNSKILIRTRGR